MRRWSALRAAFLLLALAGCAGREAGRPAAAPAMTLRAVGFADLPGWGGDRFAEVLPALRASCKALTQQPGDDAVGPGGVAGKAADWREGCAVLQRVSAPDDAVRHAIESAFVPFAVGDGTPGLFTGYYEPELAASRQRSRGFPVPLYRRPADLVTVDLHRFGTDLAGEALAGRVVDGRLEPYAARAEIEAGELAGRGLELFWLADPIDAFFLQVQGSGRLRLAGGGTVRVGYAASNGRPYTSVGRLLVERGVLTKETATLQTVRGWLRAHPAEAGPLMRQNARYIFFKRIEGDGPLGAQGAPLSPGRSLAIDASRLPLGAPFWLDTTYPAGTPEAGRPLRRLVVAQDIGVAIKGGVRGDLFWGTGDAAMRYAGAMKQPGRYFLLLPKAVAERHRSAG